MIQGTASNVGKSLLVTALCRYFVRKGLSVAPFKGLNMALNAHVTPEGFEIARAQAVQAEACGIEPSVEMNPLLLKPESNSRSQVILMGRPSGSRSARELFATGLDIRGTVSDALSSLRARHDLIVIEGAGSPAEINLRSRDVANMFIARLADAPVLLAGDIDRGGVFAAFVGTLALLEPEDRARVKGFLVNKFRGDVSLLQPGLDWLHKETGIPSLGVLPHMGALRIAEEDSLNVDARMGQRTAERAISIAVIRLPRISNHDEFQPFEHERDVSLEFTDDPSVALAADLLVLPGTKNTVGDLRWLREQGLDHIVRLRAQRGMRVLGVCGGCQMLGLSISDPDSVESSEAETEGLALLALRTQFMRGKNTQRVFARKSGESFLFAGLSADVEVPGYFIHAGITQAHGAAALESRERDGAWHVNGATSDNGAVVGTMVHGLFEHDGLRHALLDALRAERGLGPAGQRVSWDREAEYDRLADMIASSCDTAVLDRLALG
ncbi:MAG: cobyric acid synthase [Myxococcaceae bacterium]|nr:cobyric acid synthase [Myxococcaceae bacterium]